MRVRRSSGSPIEPRRFLIELALQVLGVGRDPHRRVVLPRPQIGGRQIAQRLAQPGAGFGQQDVVDLLPLARLEGKGRGAGIGTSGRRAVRRRCPAPRRRKAWASCGRDGILAAGRAAAIVLPFLDAVPGVEAGGEAADIELGVGLHDGLQHRLGPGPVGAAEEGGVLGGLAQQRIVAVGQAVQQIIGDEAQRVLVIVAGLQRQRAGEAGGRGCGKARRAGEGEEFGHIVVALVPGGADGGARGLGGHAQPLDQEGGMADQVRGRRSGVRGRCAGSIARAADRGRPCRR